MNESNLTALDLLELEMRAKLIKTMLEKQEGDDSKDAEEEKGIGNGYVPDIKIKEEPLTPESTRMGEDEVAQSPSRRHRKKYSRHRRSGSRSYSSSCSSSRSSSYSSRSSSRSRRRRSRSGTHSSKSSSSSDLKKHDSETSDSKKPTKKKITKKEFEARMKKARMNRSYRKRKDSEDDSGKEKTKGKSKKKGVKGTSYSLKKTLIENNIIPPEEEEVVDPKEDEEVEEGQEEEEEAEDGEVTEKEEGEIDSNEEGAISSGSCSRSRSYSSDSYSSCSSRSPSRRSSRRRYKRKKYRRSSRYSRSPSDTPKVPNWPQPKSEDISDADKKGSTDLEKDTEENLLVKEDRQSVSFSFSKKSSAPIKSNPELNDDHLPTASVEMSTQIDENNQQEGDASSPNANPSLEEYSQTEKTDEKEVEETKVTENENKGQIENEQKREDGMPAEVVEDFYKGADQLNFSEEEAGDGEEEDLEKFLHDDTPVEPLHIGDASLRKSIKVTPNKSEPPLASLENKKKRSEPVVEGVDFIKTAFSEGDSSMAPEDSNEPLAEEASPEEASQLESLPDTLEESSMDVLAPLPDAEVEDSQDSHTVDIIGVIDPKDAEMQEELFEEGGSSWSMRWLQSEKVQKVVSNSKMLSKVRKNIQAKGKAGVKEKTKIPEKVLVPSEPKTPVEPSVKKIEIKPATSKSSNVIGSIEEYEKLFGIKVKAPTSLPQPKSATKSSATTSILDSDDDEDSEEEALWSKIIKK